jgi:hypothetical protein
VDLFIKLKILTNIHDKESETHHCFRSAVGTPIITPIAAAPTAARKIPREEHMK